MSRLLRCDSLVFFFSSRRRHTRWNCDWSSDVCSSDLVAALGRDERITVPISGIGGIATWRDAAEFIALGSTSVQVCTAAMHYGFRIVEDMIDGLSNRSEERRVGKEGRSRWLPHRRQIQ